MTARALGWVAFFLVARRSAGLVDGVPVGPIESAGLLTVAWLVAVARWSPRSPQPRHEVWLVAGALAVSVAMGYAVPDRGGLRARYFADTTASGAFERSTEFQGAAFTRIDRRLSFEPGIAEFPLHFFNDLGRFNFYPPHELHRELLAFSVIWEGHWFVDTDAAERRLYLDARGGSADVLVDGASVMSVSPLDADRTAMLTPSRGWHALQVRFVSPYGSPRRLSVGEVVGDERTPFGAPAVTTIQLAPWQVTSGLAARLTASGIDALALAWLAGLFARTAWRALLATAAHRPVWTLSRSAIGLLLVVAAAEALIFALPWTWQTMTLVGGDDTLTYESYARQIQLDSFLLAHGGGEPFFYQVLYPYVLAGMHAIFGESMFGPMLIQRLLLSLVVGMVIAIAVRIRGQSVGIAALVCGTAFAFGLLAPISAKLLNESLYIPLLLAWAAAMMRVNVAPTTRAVAGAGILGGVTTLTRSTALLAWLVAVGSSWLSWRSQPRRATRIALLLVCLCSVMSVIAIRNWIVVHELILLPGEFPVTLYGGNEPPPGVVIEEDRRRALYDWFGLHPFTRQVLEYALASPALFLQNLLNKAVFALGYFDLYAPGWGYSIGLLAISGAGLVGLALTIRRSLVPWWVALLPAFIAATQYAAVVLVYPKGMRLILPFHALMVPYAAIAVDAIWRRLSRAT